MRSYLATVLLVSCICVVSSRSALSFANEDESDEIQQDTDRRDLDETRLLARLRAVLDNDQEDAAIRSAEVDSDADDQEDDDDDDNDDDGAAGNSRKKRQIQDSDEDDETDEPAKFTRAESSIEDEGDDSEDEAQAIQAVRGSASNDDEKNDDDDEDDDERKWIHNRAS